MQERLLLWNCTTAFGSIHKVVNGPMTTEGTRSLGPRCVSSGKPQRAARIPEPVVGV